MARIVRKTKTRTNAVNLLGSAVARLKANSTKIALVVISLCALVVAASSGLQVIGGLKQNTIENIYKQDYQAVFLTNGQVYFGKIKSETADKVVMEDIYYLQVSQSQAGAQGQPAAGTQGQPEAGAPGQPAAGAQGQPAATQPAATAGANPNDPNITIVKLGNELHGPTDMLVITRSNVLFTEDLRADSQVVAAIAKGVQK